MLVPITDRCNQNCIFCSARNRPAIADEIIEAQLMKGAESISISGGEPTLSPKLFKWLALARNKSSFLELQSNGLTFSYMEIAKKVSGYRIDLFNISFLSHISEINDTLSRTVDTLNARIQGIKNLLLLKQNVRLTIIINKFNYQTLNETVKFIHAVFPGISFIQFSFIKISGATIENPEVVLEYHEIANLLNEALGYCIKNDIKAGVDHIPLCYLKDYQFLHVDIPKIALHKTEFLDEKINIDGCGECVLNEFCAGPRRDYLDYYKNAEVIVKPIKNEI